MKKCFTLFLLSFILINQSSAQDWELAYKNAWDTRDIKVINDTLYFTRNVPTGATTYVNYLYRSITPGVILDSSKTIDGVYGCYDYNRHKGNEYIISYAPFAAQNGFRKKNQSNGQWIRKSAKGNYLIDKINDKIYVSDRYTIEVSEDAGETFSHFWSTEGTISLVGFDKDNNLYVSLKVNKPDSIGLWRVSDNGQTKTRVWSANYSITPYTGSLVLGNENRIYIHDENNEIAYSDDGNNWTLVSIPSSTFNYGGYFASSIFQLESGELIISLTTYQGGTGKTELVYKADADVSNFTLYSNGIPQTTQFHSLTYWKGYVYAKSLKGMYRMKDGSTTNLLTKSGNGLHLNIYPNPASDVLKVTCGEAIVGETYAIIDYTGRSIEQGIITNELFELRLNNLQPGLYQLKVGEEAIKSFILMR